VPQIDFDEAALEGHHIAWRSGQSIEELAPQLGRKAIRKPPLKGERDECARIEQPATFVAGDSRDGFLSIALLTALSGNPVRTAASVGVKRVSWVCMVVYNRSPYREYIILVRKARAGRNR
jgi:hypothetical protein